MTGWWLDLRVALRALRRARTMTSVAVVCLALGIGANTAVFSVVRAVLLQPLPFPDAERIVSMWVNFGNDDGSTRFFMSPQQYAEIRDRNGVLAQMAASRVEQMSLDEGEFPTEVTGARVTPSLFPLLGISPQRGRVLTPDDETSGVPVAVITDGLWARAYGRRADALGTGIRLNGVSHAIVGIVPTASRVPPDVDVWIPLGIDQIQGRDRLAGSLTVLARLADGVSQETAIADLVPVARGIARDFPERNTNLVIGLLGWQDFLVENVRTALFVLLAAVGGVMVLAVSNVASLMIVRARRERRQQALRTALGATPRRVMRYLLFENGIVTGAGLAAGLIAARLSLPALLALQPTSLSPFRAVSLDLAVLTFAIVLSVVVAGVITALTVWRLGMGSLTRGLSDGGMGGGVSRGTLRVQQGLVIGQLAASVVLMVGSTLLLKSFLGIRDLDPGFEPSEVLVIRVAAPPSRADTHEGKVAYLEEILESLRRQPGVAAAGAAHVLPVTDIRWGLGFNVEGQPPETRTARHVAVWRITTPGYYESMGVRILRGRGFETTDRPNGAPVALVSQLLADQYWPGENPIGKRVKRGTYDDRSEPWRTVVGVTADVRDSALAGRPRASVHFPHAQFPTSIGHRMQVVVRLAGGDPRDQAARLEDVVRQVDRSALVYEVVPFADLLGETVAQDRFNTLLLAIFAGTGLLLAAVGIYGVVSYAAAQRRVEFGIRLALGARGSDVGRLMLRAGTTMAVAGAAAGVALAYGFAPLLDAMLATGDPRAPAPYAVAAGALMMTTILAAWIPARRATKVNPISVLRQ